MGRRFVVSRRDHEFPLGKHVRRRWFLDVRRHVGSDLHLRRSAGWGNWAGEPVHARDARDQAAAELWREETALQLEYADSHEPERKGDDLPWRAIPVSLPRSR